MNKKLVAFAEDFVSFLLQEMENKQLSNVKEIILFGSVARGEATKKSDVDIFIDIIKEEKTLGRSIPFIIENFYRSSMFKKYWRLMGVDNEIKCVVGKLDTWEDLKPSIISDGIILFGKYSGTVKKGGKSFVIITWDKVKPESKRVFLSKKLYGYSMNDKQYRGILEGTGTTKLGSSCLFVPIENSKQVLETIKNLDVRFKTIHVSRLI